MIRFGDLIFPEGQNQAGPLARFMVKVQQDEGGCWLWTASLGSTGYSQFNAGSGKIVPGHRWIYEQLVGPIPDGLQIDHLCRVRRCVNPAHLEPVTQRENILRGEAFSARNARKTRCDHGHPFVGDNLIIVPSGGRQCRACRDRSNAARDQNNGGPMPCVVCGEEFIASRGGCKYCSVRCKNAARFIGPRRSLNELQPDEENAA